MLVLLVAQVHQTAVDRTLEGPDEMHLPFEQPPRWQLPNKGEGAKTA
jgi:hypothetical protein